MLKKSFLLVVLFLLSAISSLEASPEDKIKSIYLGRFSMFFKWPKKNDTFNICIYNDAKFSKNLLKEYKNKLPNGTTLNVIGIKVGGLSKVRHKCHIFYARNESLRKKMFLLDDFDKTDVLLVSDEHDDVYNASTISFYLKNNKIRFVINHQKLLESGLEVSSKLLKYAKVVNPVGSSDAK